MPWRVVGLLSLVSVALALRGCYLEHPPLWADEAESAINALTIVADGRPTNYHLGIPLFENTLIRPWPESAEYEFRDLSYSDRGLAIYHGWLPLYSIAAAFRLAGVTPEMARRGTPPADSSAAEISRWTAVPRWPSLFFSGLFVLGSFFLARQVYDTEAGWAMALLAALASTLVDLGWQARYYSATLAFQAICGLAIWNAIRRGRWRDHALAGLALGLLFHTHALSAVTMAGLFAAMLLVARPQPHFVARLGVAGLVASTLVVPWVVWSGFTSQAMRIPYAWRTLSLSILLQTLPSSDPATLFIGGAGIFWLGCVTLLGHRLPLRWRGPVEDHSAAFYFALIWTTLAYVNFVCMVPAASYWLPRIKLAVAVPGCLLVTVVLTGVARAVRPMVSWLPSAGILLFLWVTGQFEPVTRGSSSPAMEVARLMRSWQLDAGSRIFAAPNHHLTLTYYAGRPVQSAAPVRKSWFDGFAGDLVIVEHHAYSIPSAREVLEIAGRMGVELTAAEAEARAAELKQLSASLELVGRVAAMEPPLRPLSDLDHALLEATWKRTREQISEFTAQIPLAHTTVPANWRDFWLFFFYSFSDPDRRIGPQLNYYERTRRARAYVLRSGWVIYDCRPLNTPPLTGLAPESSGADDPRIPSEEPRSAVRE